MRYFMFVFVLTAITSMMPVYAFAQAKLTTDEFVDALRVPVSDVEIDVKDIHERALERMKKPGKPQDRPPLVEELNKLPQITVDIQFNSDSSVIRPESYKVLGRIADALYHPYLLDQKVLIVGHIEATGRRQNNLDLSQKRASALREALVTTFRVSPQRLVALGLGEEQLEDRAKPTAPVNRRVQLMVIGRR